MGRGRRHIAVVGSGIAGLTAAYVLQRNADVTLYEADSRLGGHSHTHDVIDGGASGPTLAVDSGFIVHNAATYPTLLRLFDELGVQTQAAEMSMSVSCSGCGLEYAGARGAARPLRPTAFAARGRATCGCSPRFRASTGRLARLLAASEHHAPNGDQTLTDFLAEGRYSHYFVRHFITPMVAAVWSCAPRRPAATRRATCSRSCRTTAL